MEIFCFTNRSFTLISELRLEFNKSKESKVTNAVRAKLNDFFTKAFNKN